MLRDTKAGRNRSKTPSRRVRQGKVMNDREAGLFELGVIIGPSAQVDDSGPIASAPVSGYGEYTPVTVRNYTVRTENAGMERNQSRD